jgi:hypothetical protein
MTILIACILFLQAVALVTVLWFWRSLNQRSDQLQILLTALHNQEASLGQTAERLTLSAQEVNQMAVELRNIAAWTGQQQERENAEAVSVEQVKEQTQLIIAAIEKETAPSIRTICLTKLFVNNAQQLSAFDHFLNIASNQINKAIEARQLSLAFDSLNNATKVIETYAPALSFDEIKQLIAKLDVLRNTTHLQINGLLQEMLSQKGQPAITFQLLDMLDPREIDQSLLERLREKRKELEAKARDDQAKIMARVLQTEIEGVDGESGDAENRLQHIQMKVLRLTQGSDDLAKVLLPLKHIIEAKRNLVLKQQRMTQLFADKDRVEAAINILNAFNEPVLASGDRLVTADEAAKFMTYVCSQYDILAADGNHSNPTIQIDTKALTKQVQNVELSKLNSYQTWALNKIESAFKMFNESSFPWDDEQKRKLICNILSDTLWLIDEQALTSSISSLYHTIEQKLLDKAKEEPRIKIIKEGLLKKRLGFADIQL